ncbi:MAG: FtsX-like permease family protein [Deltaproteobacteria bacterium]|nr:FtsX-like permease family protein [Deltaproteobacteria bacterium]
MTRLDRIALLLWMGVRNVFAHKVKSLLVGGILFFGTVLIVVGGSLLGSVQASMERSVTSSLSGHAQVYAKDAKDALSLFPSGPMGSMDVGEIPDFHAVRETLVAMPGVLDVVPMGILDAIVLQGTELDRLLDRLRDAVAGGRSDEVSLLTWELQNIASGLERDLLAVRTASADPSKEDAEIADLRRVQDPAFWADLAADPESGLTFLESRVAPLGSDGKALYLRLIGTDLSRFEANFDRFRIVDGSRVPAGSPGLLVTKRFYETQVKNAVARGFDTIREARRAGRTLAEDPLLQEEVRRNVRQRRRVLYQIRPDEAEAVRAELLEVLPGASGDLDAILETFLQVDDANFEVRHEVFYRAIAPRIRLYDLAIGDTITLRSFTRSGYARAANVTLYGTFEFQGLERADLTSVNHLVDLTTFRSLYGSMSAGQQAELADIRASVGVDDVARDEAEAALFGGDPNDLVVAPEAEAAPTDTPPTWVRDVPPASDDGPVLNAAVVLDPGSSERLSVSDLQAELDARDLGVQVVDWKRAAGLIGQLVTVLQVVLWVGVAIVFIVAMAIVNNTMMMSVMERVQEVGTLRAIGTQRRAVVGIFLVETAILGLVAGVAGAGVGLALVAGLHAVGIPAVADILVLVFAGPSLHPTLSLAGLVEGILLVLVVALVSAFQPTLLAARTSPAVAMSPKE